MTIHYYIDDHGVKEYKVWFKILLGFAVLYTYITGMAYVLVNVESGAATANIKLYADAFWVLQMSTSTIGFGDFYPVTLPGRVIVAMSFYVGVGIAGFVGAVVAGLFTNFTDNSVKNRELMQQNTQIIEKLYGSVQNKELRVQNAQILEQMELLMKHIKVEK